MRSVRVLAVSRAAATETRTPGRRYLSPRAGSHSTKRVTCSSRRSLRARIMETRERTALPRSPTEMCGKGLARSLRPWSGCSLGITSTRLAQPSAGRVRSERLRRDGVTDTATSCSRWRSDQCLGALSTNIGALGVMPDLACAVIGSVLVLVGAAGGVAAWVVARRDRELGRRISLAEPFASDRDPSTGVALSRSLGPVSMEADGQATS